jgi:hypothetical protein
MKLLLSCDNFMFKVCLFNKMKSQIFHKISNSFYELRPILEVDDLSQGLKTLWAKLFQGIIFLCKSIGIHPKDAKGKNLVKSL